MLPRSPPSTSRRTRRCSRRSPRSPPETFRKYPLVFIRVILVLFMVILVDFMFTPLLLRRSSTTFSMRTQLDSFTTLLPSSRLAASLQASLKDPLCIIINMVVIRAASEDFLSSPREVLEVVVIIMAALQVPPEVEVAVGTTIQEEAMASVLEDFYLREVADEHREFHLRRRRRPTPQLQPLRSIRAFRSVTLAWRPCSRRSRRRSSLSSRGAVARRPSRRTWSIGWSRLAWIWEGCTGTSSATGFSALTLCSALMPSTSRRAR